MLIKTTSRFLVSGSLFGLVAAAAAVPTAAQAQTAAATDASMETIVVTARKREESLVAVPLAVTVFSQANIEDRGINTLADLSAFTPGFDFQETGQGGASGRDNPNIRFRGVAVQNENPASRAGAIFFNNSYISGGVGLLPLFDLQRVEVIKGPQNALYGRNTFAGAVNFIPAEPGDEFGGFVNGLYSPSDQDTAQIQAAVSIPITDTLGIRVGASYRRAGADFKFANGDPLGTEITGSFQGTLVYDNKEGVKLKTTGYWVNASDTRQTVSIGFNAAPGQCDLTYSGELRAVKDGANLGSFTTDISKSTIGTICGEVPDYDGPGGFFVSPVGRFRANVPLGPGSATPSFMQTLPPEAAKYSIPAPPNGLGNTYRTWLINQTGEFDLPGDHSLNLLASYGENGSYRIRDAADGSNITNIRLTAFAFYSYDFNAEARIASSDEGRLRYQLGFNYYKSASRTFEFLQFSGLGGTNDDQRLVFLDSEVYGVFGNVDFDITDALTLSLEGRYGTDTLTTVYNGPTLRDFPPPPAPQPTAVRNFSQSYTRFMPRVLLSYNPNEKLNIYGSWALSYLQGSDTNVTEYSAAVPQAGLDPATFGIITPVQRLNAFEIGLKAAPSSNLSFSIAGYYMDWENQVQFELSSFLTGFRPLFSPGDSRYKGIEVEATYVPIDWFRFEGNFSYVDAELTNFAGAGSLAAAVLRPGLADGTQISANGNRPRYVPTWTGAAAGTIRFNKLMGFEQETFLRVDALYFGDFYIDNFEFNEVPASWRFNARLSSKIAKNVRFDLYGLNLTNDLSFNSSGGDTGGNRTAPAPGGFNTRRTFGTLPRAREVGLEVFIDF
jgi:iron complex outermembrane receptor protein